MKNQARAARTAPNGSQPNQAADICELLIAELQLRRERLRELLRMVALEAERHLPARAPKTTRSRCSRAKAA